MGHNTFAGLACRGLLSLFHTVYRFIAAHYDQPAPLWAEARAELRAFRGLLFLAWSDWWLPWCPFVYQSDASLEAWVVKTAKLDPTR